ncbi:hypothetical protein CDAR_609521 [Caerostris darwini]|uniref:Uncharacterized protein n=1 Tax=Caerostris darwini TaxID=1538125 RepID=A0AAV4SBC4_9ARAC|nr:hypothetical protein CDAR_609521 [Caerostris darwini]
MTSLPLPLSHDLSGLLSFVITPRPPQFQCSPFVVHVPTPSASICIKDARLLHGNASERVSRSLERDCFIHDITSHPLVSHGLSQIPVILSNSFQPLSSILDPPNFNASRALCMCQPHLQTFVSKMSDCCTEVPSRESLVPIIRHLLSSKQFWSFLQVVNIITYSTEDNLANLSRSRFHSFLCSIVTLSSKRKRVFTILSAKLVCALINYLPHCDDVPKFLEGSNMVRLRGYQLIEDSLRNSILVTLGKPW